MLPAPGSAESVGRRGAWAPWMSVVIPLYNGERYIGETLDSLVAQEDPGLEVLLIDDGSADRGVAVAERYAGRLRIRVERRPHGGNWTARFNEGLSLASAAYVSFLSQDDLWRPGRSAALKRLAEAHPDAVLIAHATLYIDDLSRRLGVLRPPLPAGRVDASLVLERLIVQNFISSPSFAFRRDAALRVGGMDEALWYLPDWDLLLKLAAAGPVVHDPRIWSAYRLHSASQSSSDRTFGGEMDVVLGRHLPRLEGRPPGTVHDVNRMARLSADLNVTLAALAKGRRSGWPAVSRRLLALGPAGLWRFVRRTRIHERVLARVRGRLWSRRTLRSGGESPGV
jgi:glycosyltransferase involved in cell wall biosynthesis